MAAHFSSFGLERAFLIFVCDAYLDLQIVQVAIFKVMLPENNAVKEPKISLQLVIFLRYGSHLISHQLCLSRCQVHYVQQWQAPR